jgi:hypothetical protein
MARPGSQVERAVAEVASSRDIPLVLREACDLLQVTIVGSLVKIGPAKILVGW